MEEEFCLPWRVIAAKYIGVREIQSMLFKHASKLKKGIFCIALTPSNWHHCDQLTCRSIWFGFGLVFCGVGNPFIGLYAKYLENSLRKYISVQGIFDWNKSIFRCSLFCGSSRTCLFADFPAAAVWAGTHLWLQCKQKLACEDLKNGQAGREQSTNKSS